MEELRLDRKLYLAIESSCDETSLAILTKNDVIDEKVSFYNNLNSFEVLGSIISSQIETHAKFGGVVPEVGARQHAEQIHALFKTFLAQIIQSDKSLDPDSALTQAELNIVLRLEKILVTTEPGLVSALRVGVEFAKSLSFFIQQQTNKIVEVVSVNHLRGHLSSAFYHPEADDKILDSDLFPHIHLLVSGGNSQLILMNDWTDWQIIGQTLDDAAGECFDKVGRMLGLPYPGGVYLAKIADQDNQNYSNFTVGMLQNKTLDYSFSGLKTAVRYYLQSLQLANYSFEAILSTEECTALLNHDFESSEKLKLIYQVCVSVQNVIVKQLMNKLENAIQIYKPNSIGLSGGVSANLLLRSEFKYLKIKYSLKHVFFPDVKLSGDNAIMIGLAGSIS